LILARLLLSHTKEQCARLGGLDNLKLPKVYAAYEAYVSEGKAAELRRSDLPRDTSACRALLNQATPHCTLVPSEQVVLLQVHHVAAVADFSACREGHIRTESNISWQLHIDKRHI
jgi:hypothetical protein